MSISTEKTIEELEIEVRSQRGDAYLIETAEGERLHELMIVARQVLGRVSPATQNALAVTSHARTARLREIEEASLRQRLWNVSVHTPMAEIRVALALDEAVRTMHARFGQGGPERQLFVHISGEVKSPRTRVELTRSVLLNRMSAFSGIFELHVGSIWSEFVRGFSSGSIKRLRPYEVEHSLTAGYVVLRVVDAL